MWILETDRSEVEANHLYVQRHFWKLEQLAEAIGASADRVEQLIAARCGPEPSYVLDDDELWSAIERDQRHPPSGGTAWYSRASAWGLRRALLESRHGAALDEAAAHLEEAFQAAFIEALAKTEGAQLAFPACFVGGAVSRDMAERCASHEWQSWLDGGYGVCLRIFTGRTCVEKESLGAFMKAALGSGRYDPDELLLKAETLSGLLLPFAPWQRSRCTPGLTIDRLLEEQGLGDEQPFGDFAAPRSFGK